MNQPRNSQQSDIQNQGASVMEDGCQGNSRADNSKMPFSSNGSPVSDMVLPEVISKRRKQSGDSGECVDTEENVVVDDNDDIPSRKNVECHEKNNLRRSVRLKQQVSDKGNCNNYQESTNHPKRAKESKSSFATEISDDAGRKEACRTKKQLEQEKVTSRGKGITHRNMETEKKSSKETTEECDSEDSSEASTEISDLDASLDSSTTSEGDRELYLCPQSEFNDFDKDKNEMCFAAGQIWAVYDTLDAMPRFYAWVRNVVLYEFNLKITWLDPDPNNKDEIEWVNEGLPVSCGKFRIGDTEDTDDRLMFSHLICRKKGKARKRFKIYPRKGETWALFKNWDIKWKPDAETDTKFEFEYVEILSEYVEGEGTSVAPLGKVKGFVSVFCRTVKEGVDVFQVPSNELFRFSHQIPSYKLTGEEREGVPKDSFELDPASLPSDIEEITAQENLKTGAVDWNLNASCSSSEKLNPTTQSRESSPLNQD